MGWACGICQIWKYVNWMLAYICVRISLIKRASSGPPCCFGVVRLVLSIHDICLQRRVTREFKITTTATATGTSLNKRFNEQNNSCARAL